MVCRLTQDMKKQEAHLMTKSIIESILSGKILEAREQFDNYAKLYVGIRIEEARLSVIPSRFITEESSHNWFIQLSTEQQKSYLKMHSDSKLNKFFKLDSSGNVVSSEDSDIKSQQTKTISKQDNTQIQKKPIVVDDDTTQQKPIDGITLDSLRKKQTQHKDYDKTPAKEVKGKSAQDILAKSGSPTDMTGPDIEANKEGGDTEFERDLVAGLSNLAKDVTEYKKRRAEAESSGKEFTEKKPEFELCQITIPNTNLFCSNNMGVPRGDMPQLSGTPVEGSKADSLPKGKDGGVDVSKLYAQQLEKDGIKTKPRKVDVATLKATQTNLGGEKIAGMVETLKVDPKNEALNSPIYVSKDGYILDGHHRWAALLTLGIADGIDAPVAMNVVEVDMGIKDLLDYTNKFTDDIGIQKKVAGETTGEKK